MEYRVEQKFLCNHKDYILLKSRLPHIMQLDQNAHADDSYQIRSVYFDDMYQSKFHENEQGSDDRFKYRIRSYDCNDAVIHLEKKSKLNTYTNKKSCAVTKSEYETFMAGNFSFTASENRLKNEFALSILLYGMTPSAIIDYTREAYTYQAGNVRVTFDSHICASTDYSNFFREDMDSIPLLYENEFILEVKYDEFLPKEIANLLEIKTLQQITFSKFYVGKQKLLQFTSGLQ